MDPHTGPAASNAPAHPASDAVIAAEIELQPEMPTRTHSLAEVAAVYLPHLKDGALWLHRRIRSGEIPGYKVGRTFRMTDEHIAAWMNTPRRNPTEAPAGVDVVTPPVTPPASILDGLSARSRARITRRAQS